MDLTYVYLALGEVLIFVIGGIASYWFLNTFGKVAIQNAMGGTKGVAVLSMKGNKLKFLVRDFSKPTLSFNGKDYHIDDAIRYYVGNIPIIFLNDGNALPIKLELDKTMITEKIAVTCPKCNEAFEAEGQFQKEYELRAPAEYLSAIIVKIWALTQSAFFKLNQALLWGTLIMSIISLLGIAYLVLAGVPGVADTVNHHTTAQIAQLIVTPIPKG